MKNLATILASTLFALNSLIASEDYPKSSRGSNGEEASIRRAAVVEALKSGDFGAAAAAAEQVRLADAVPDESKAEITSLALLVAAERSTRDPAKRMAAMIAAAKRVAELFPNQPHGYQSLINLSDDAQPSERAAALGWLEGRKLSEGHKAAVERRLVRERSRGAVSEIAGVASKAAVIVAWSEESPRSVALANVALALEAERLAVALVRVGSGDPMQELDAKVTELISKSVQPSEGTKLLDQFGLEPGVAILVDQDGKVVDVDYHRQLIARLKSAN